MRNEHGLTNKQFLFCEELLRNGMVVSLAYKHAYPNDHGTNNGPRMFKRGEVVRYINMRLQQKQATMDVLLDTAHKRLIEIINNGSHKDAAKAIEVLANMNIRAKSLEVPAEGAVKSIQINFHEATKE